MVHCSLLPVPPWPKPTSRAALAIRRLLPLALARTVTEAHGPSVDTASASALVVGLTVPLKSVAGWDRPALVDSPGGWVRPEDGPGVEHLVFDRCELAEPALAAPPVVGALPARPCPPHPARDR
jgi:hypothetical protein